MTAERARLKADVCQFIERGGSDGEFNALALGLFRWHLAAMPSYRDFCERRLSDASRITDWRAIPPLPVEAFRYAELSCSPSEQIVHRFSTSGTSTRPGTTGRRGTSAFDRDALDVMDRAIEANGAARLFPDGVRCRIFVLAPPPEDAPHMIMAYGMRRLMSAYGDDASGFFARKDGLDVDSLLRAIERACAEQVPVCVIGASFGFVHLLDALAATGRGVMPLPAGSRLMDAGGYKGRSRELTPEAFRELVGRAFGLADSSIVNLLGMTELASQIYDSSLSAAVSGERAPRRKLPPHWVRTRVTSVDDPTRDAEADQVGFLVHYDLANFSRPLALLSDDLGQRLDEGFRILGRVKSSEPRGCSVSVDELWRHA